MAGGSATWLGAAAAVAGGVALRGLRRGSLSRSGALAAFLVGFFTMAYGFRFGATLILFYQSSSALTKYKAAQKRDLEEDFKEGGQRDWTQVLANTFPATVLCAVLWYTGGWTDRCLDSTKGQWETSILAAILGQYACCNGDTWASEIGILSASQPRLITTWKKVPPGTNGGISVTGLAASAAGGGFIGFFFFLFGIITTGNCGHGFHVTDSTDFWTCVRQFEAVPLGIVAGLFGSALDSLLGATLQYSGFCMEKKKVVSRCGPSVKHISGVDVLSNGQVNFVSAVCTTTLTGGVALLVF